MSTTSRDHFVDTIWERDEDSGAAMPLNNIQVSVYRLDDNGNRLTVGATSIYAGRIGATQRSNPFTTVIDGLVDFWAETGEYEVEFVDLTIPARITTTTIGWNALPGAKFGLPSDRVGKDAGLDLTAFAPNAMRQVKQLGEIWQWWRPAADIAIPTDSEPCDGRVVTSDNHDFGGSVAAASITLPDLRNKFVIGTEVPGIAGYAGDGAAGVDGSDTATDAPGIGRVGGSNAHTLTEAQIPVHDHGHTLSVNNAGAHSHSHSIGALMGTSAQNGGQQGILNAANYGSSAVLGSPWIQGGINGVGDHSHGLSGGVSNAGSGQSHNNQPRYVGVLMLMKVRYS